MNKYTWYNTEHAEHAGNGYELLVCSLLVSQFSVFRAALGIYEYGVMFRRTPSSTMSVLRVLC